MAERSALGIRALAMIPADGSEQWRSLLKYGQIVGRWEEGERVLETNVLGRWVPSSVRRPTALVVFPRTAGALPRRVARGRYVDTVADARRRSRCGPAPHVGLSTVLRYKPACRKTVVYWL